MLPLPAVVPSVLPAATDVLVGKVLDPEGVPVIAVEVRAYPAESLPEDAVARRVAGDAASLVANHAVGLVANDVASRIVAGERSVSDGRSLVDGSIVPAAASRSTLTDGEGIFRISLPAGRYNLEARGKPGFKACLPGFAWPAAEAPGPTLTLAATASVKGRISVLVDKGEPSPPRGEVLVPGSPYVAPVLADGSFVLSDLPSGRLPLVIWQPERGAVRYPPEGLVLLPSGTLTLPAIEVPEPGASWRVVAVPSVKVTASGSVSTSGPPLAVTPSPSPSPSPSPVATPSEMPMPQPTAGGPSVVLPSPSPTAGPSQALATLENRLDIGEPVVAVAHSRAGHMAAMLGNGGKVVVMVGPSGQPLLASWTSPGMARAIGLQQHPGSADEDAFVAYADGRMERTRVRTDGTEPEPDMVVQATLSAPLAWAGPDVLGTGFWVGAGEVRHEVAGMRESAIMDVGPGRTTCGELWDGRVLLGLDNGTVTVLDRGDGHRLASWTTRPSAVIGLAIGGVNLQTGEGLVLGAQADGSMTVWVYPSGKLVWVRDLGAAVGTIAMSLGNPFLGALAEGDGAVRLIDLSTGTDRSSLQPDVGPIRALRFTPDGSRLWVAGDRGVSIWRFASTGP